MIKSKKIDVICVVVISLALVLSVVFCFGERLGITVVKSEENSDSLFTANDLLSKWDESGATKIVFSGRSDANTDVTGVADDTGEVPKCSAKVTGNGAYANGSDVTIKYAGKYIVSGEASGSITVDAESDDKIWIMLDGISLTAEGAPAIDVEQAGKVFLTVKSGTENTLGSMGATTVDKFTTASAESLADSAAPADNSNGFTDAPTPATNSSGSADGAIYSRDNLTINGTGKLTVKSSYKHGIVCNDKFVITGGDISIIAIQDAIHIHDKFNFTQASLKISAGDDAIHVGDSDNWSVINIVSGSINISDCYEGIEANEINISGGDIVIKSSDDGINANGGSSGFGGGMHGKPDGETPSMPGGEPPSKPDGEAPSMPGGEPPSKPDGEVPSMPDSMQASPSDRSGGEPPSKPDGKSDGDSTSEPSGKTPSVNISGGNIRILNENGRDADGIDSNGDITITGGYIFISLRGDGSNSAIDFASESNSKCTISGGSIIACGGSGMAEGFDEASTQGFIMQEVNGPAGSTFAVKDASGTLLLSEIVPYEYTSVVASAPGMSIGDNITMMINSEATTLTIDNKTATLEGSRH